MALQFVKQLSKTDAEKRLSLPTKFTKHLPCVPCGQAVVNLAVMDVHGTEWYFRYTIRRKGHPKPVLLSGWLDFVKCKCLRPGDQIIFKLEPNANAHALYTIQVKRRIRLLGKEVWTDVF